MYPALTYRTPLHRPDSLTQQLLAMWSANPQDARNKLDVIELDIAERTEAGIPHPFI